jgi:hypothetical protein
MRALSLNHQIVNLLIYVNGLIPSHYRQMLYFSMLLFYFADFRRFSPPVRCRSTRLRPPQSAHLFIIDSGSRVRRRWLRAITLPPELFAPLGSHSLWNAKDRQPRFADIDRVYKSRGKFEQMGTNEPPWTFQHLFASAVRIPEIVAKPFARSFLFLDPFAM